MRKGKVKWFSQRIGAGFINTADGKDVFFNVNVISDSNWKIIRECQRVSLDVLKSQNGITLSAANVKPLKPTLNALKIAAPLVLAIFLWITVCGEAQGGTLYEYTDKNGAVVITDRPPPGVKATPKTSYPPITEEQKSAWEREKAEQLQQNPKGDEAKKEKQKKIRAVRAELKKAIRDEQHYRSNMNQSANYSQRHHWRLLVDEQEKVIAEKRKKLKDLESKP